MWRRVHVADVCETVSVGIVIQPSQYYVAPSQGIRAFRSANVGENRIVDRDWVYLSPEGHRANSKSSLRAGDVLVVRSGAPGTACVVTEEYAGSNCIDIVFARPHQDQVLPEYLAEFTNSPVGRRHVLGTQGGLALKHFNVGAYKQLELLQGTGCDIGQGYFFGKPVPIDMACAQIREINKALPGQPLPARRKDKRRQCPE